MIIDNRRDMGGFDGKKPRSMLGSRKEKRQRQEGRREERESSDNWLMRQRADWREGGGSKSQGTVHVLCHGFYLT